MLPNPQDMSLNDLLKWTIENWQYMRAWYKAEHNKPLPPWAPSQSTMVLDEVYRRVELLKAGEIPADQMCMGDVAVVKLLAETAKMKQANPDRVPDVMRETGTWEFDGG